MASLTKPNFDWFHLGTSDFTNGSHLIFLLNHSAYTNSIVTLKDAKKTPLAQYTNERKNQKIQNNHPSLFFLDLSGEKDFEQSGHIITQRTVYT